jgi:endonuclease/exonuclease/phosphatase family metal-dependent hydrolase
MERPNIIRVMSYNIWGNCPKGTTISNRDDLVAAVILRYLPDSAGLQECSPKMRAEEPNIFALLAAEYEEVPVTPTNEKKNNYTPILYRKNRLELIDCGWHYFAGLNDSGSKTITWACYRLRDPDAGFLHFNTHFYWTGDDPGRAARITNTGELLALMLEVTAKYSLPAVFTGDFNCRSDEPPVDVLRKFGLVEARYEAPESSPWRSHHAYPKYDPERGVFGEGTCPSREAERSIDHILSRGDISPQRFVTVIDREALDSSDHCPLFCDFELGITR